VSDIEWEKFRQHFADVPAPRTPRLHNLRWIALFAALAWVPIIALIVAVTR
jgi:hypothetical protein